MDRTVTEPLPRRADLPTTRPGRPAARLDRHAALVGIGWFAAVGVVVWIAVWLASNGLFGMFGAGRVETYFHGPRALGGWMHWDGEWYRRIAVDGYFFSTERQSSVAFFPAYPLSLRALAAVAGDSSLWGIVVTALSGAAAAALFVAWTRRVRLGHSASTALLVLLLWPYGYYLFGAVYADALFLAALLGAFVLLELDQPVAAGLAGAVATATRPVGAAVILGLVLCTLYRRQVVTRSSGRVHVDVRRLRGRDFGVLLSVGGLALYMAYLAARFGNPLAFVEAEKAPGWVQDASARVWLKYAFWHRLVELPTSGTQYFAAIAFQAVLVLGLLALVPLVGRRLGWGYASYTLVVLVMPLLGSKDFQGLGRYALAAFPVFAVIGDGLQRRPRARVVWLGASAGVLLFLTAAYSRGAYLA